MASSSQIEAGRAFVRLFLKNDMASQLRRALRSAGSNLQSFGRNTMMAGAKMAGIGTAILSPFAYAVKAAGDLAETQNKFNAVFAESADAVAAWAEEYRTAVGRSKKETLDALSAFQGFFSGLGMGTTEAAEFSKQMASLSVDFASFHNLSDQEGMERFISALSGSGEVLDRFGVNIKVAALDLKLMEMGFPKVSKGATETQKVLARMAIIRDSMGRQGAVGDAVKTAGSLANQLKALRAALMEVATEVGTVLVPYVTKLVSGVRQAVVIAVEWVRQNKGLVVAVAAVGAAIVVAGSALFAFGVAAFGIGTALSALGAAVGAIISPIGLITAAVAAAAVAFVKWSETGRAAYTYLADNFGQLLSWVKTVFAGIRNAMAAGDMQLASEIMWAGIQVVWTKGLAWIQTQWAKGSFAILDTMNYLWSGMVNGFWATADRVVDAWKWAEKSLAKGIAYVIAKLQGLDPNEVMSMVEEDYGRQAAQRDTGRSARDRANREAAESRYAAIEEARQSASAGADEGLADARKRLSEALKRAAALEPVPPGAEGSGPSFDLPGTPGGGGQASRRVGFTATYSAAAARIAGYQGGPEQKMADGIQQVARNTQELIRQQEEFLAGWRVA